MAAPTPMSAAAREVRKSGPLLDSWQIEFAIGRCLHQRLVPWLDEVARQQGDAKPVQRPKWIGVLRGEDGMPENHIPRVMVYCRGTTGTPEYRGDHDVYGRWEVQVAALCDDTDPGMAYRLACIYGAAIAACVGIHAVEHLEQIDDVWWRGGNSTMMLPTGGLTTQTFEVLAGPAFSLSGSLAPLPPAPGPGADDQGDQPLVIETNLNLTATDSQPNG